MRWRNCAALAEELGGRLIGHPSESEIIGISTDTRENVARKVFLALIGSHFDGHSFLSTAFEKGARAAIVSRVIKTVQSPQILVENTANALWRLARKHRESVAARIVGIVGSVGKSSTRAMVARVTAAKFRTHETHRNENNEFGVAKTLLGLSEAHEICVLEMGMRGVNEIKQLCAMSLPEIGVITNIGVAHIERFSSQADIVKAKGELLAALPPTGVGVINADDKYFEALKAMTSARVVSFGYSRSADYRITDLQLSGNGYPMFRVNGDQITIPAAGIQHAGNAAAAFAVGSILGIDAVNIVKSLKRFRGLPMRTQMYKGLHDTIVIDDSFNASPTSMLSLLDTLFMLGRRFQRRTVAVLGTMAGLGRHEQKFHAAIGKAAQSKGIHVVCVGTGGKMIKAAACDTLDSWEWFRCAKDAAKNIWNIVRAGDVVAVKASHTEELHLVVGALTGCEHRGRSDLPVY